MIEKSTSPKPKKGKNKKKMPLSNSTLTHSPPKMGTSSHIEQEDNMYSEQTGDVSDEINEEESHNMEVRRKTQAEKEFISHQRHQQILTYKCLVTKEERQRRYNSRNGIVDHISDEVSSSFTDPISVPSSRSASPSRSNEQSPRKKKRVSFESN